MFGVGFLPYPSVFDKTFSTHYFNGGKQEKMKKRLLSMLMAVLMIASLVPGMALADDVKPVIDIKADAAAKQPGIVVTEVKTGDVVTGYNVEIKAFAKLADICDADKHVPVTKELIVADCGKAGLTVTYCSVCGKDLNKNVVTEPLHHDCEFTVVAAPVCAKADGWGYAVCKKCGNPIAVDKSTDFTKLVEQGKTESTAAYAKRVADVAKLFTAADAHDYQTVTADIVVKENGKDVVKAYAGVEATHVAMLVENNNFVNLNNQWKDGGYISTGATGYSQLVKDGKVIAVTGNMTEAGVACTKCGVIQSAGVKDKANTNLNVAHAKYITVTDPGKRPVMFTDGSYKDGKAATYFCSKCGKTFGGEVLSAVKWFNITETAMPKIGDVKIYEGETVYKLAADGKNVLMIAAADLNKAVAATCHAEGNTGDVIVYTASGAADKDGNIPAVWMLKEVGKKIDKIDHHFVAKPDKLATCKDNGEHYVGIYVCDNVIGKENGKDVLCNQEKHDVIHNTTPIPAAHTPTVVVLVEATCQHDGLSVLQCSVCKQYLNVKETADGYEYAGTVATAGTAPAYVVKQVKHMAAAELKDAKEATCTEVGYTGDKVCKWCGIVLEKGKEIPMKEHTVVDVAAVEATCTADGMTAGTKCSVCGTVLSGCEVVKALGHDFKDGKCTRCGAADPNYVVPNPFKDVEKTSPYYDAIIWAAKEEITTGKTADTFGIDEGCTRAQIVTFLYRAAGSPEVKADTVNPFTDVSKDSVYYNAILWAVEKGITKGTTETTFDPNAVCTRGQIVTFLFRASGDEKVATGTNFADVASGSYCADAVAWAVANKVANGFADGTFRPEATCTRGQAVTFIFRALAK